MASAGPPTAGARAPHATNGTYRPPGCPRGSLLHTGSRPAATGSSRRWRPTATAAARQPQRRLSLERPAQPATRATGFRRASWVFFSLGRVAENGCFCCRGGPPTCVLETQGETALQYPHRRLFDILNGAKLTSSLEPVWNIRQALSRSEEHT